MWPQITIISLWAVETGLYLANHGKPKGNYNFYMYIIVLLLNYWILDSGGFFNNIK